MVIVKICLVYEVVYKAYICAIQFSLIIMSHINYLCKGGVTVNTIDIKHYRSVCLPRQTSPPYSGHSVCTTHCLA